MGRRADCQPAQLTRGRLARSPPLHGFHVESQALLLLVGERLPGLARSEALGDILPAVTSRWLLTLWIDVLPPPLLVAVWDRILAPDLPPPDLSSPDLPPSASASASASPLAAIPSAAVRLVVLFCGSEYLAS